MRDNRKLAVLFMCFLLSGTVCAAIVPIELTPSDVDSASSSVFSILPTAAPTIFGLTGADVRGINFDTTSNGTPLSSGTVLTTQYADLGVIMNSIRLESSVYGGPASAPNTTKSSSYGTSQIFTFSVPVTAVGVINTSPDKDIVELWSGPNATGTMLYTFEDQQGLPMNYNIDRFVGGRATGGDLIGSFVRRNASGDIELDELIFEIPEPATVCLLGLGRLMFCRRKSPQ